MGSKTSKPEKRVIAIDFGTSCSGYAKKCSSTSDIELNNNWGGEVGFQSWKTPTSLLYHNNDTYFGYQAENKFMNISEWDPDAILYQKFKMNLYENEGNDVFCIKDFSTNHSKDALEVFTEALQYLRKHAIGKTRQDDNINTTWVITVPAIWKDMQKLFMRKACKKAGLISALNSKQLIIALEPECASLWCRELSWDKFVDCSQINAPKFKDGTVYMVVDMGGGTVDMTVHETAGRCVHQKMVSTGNDCGGDKVNQAFEEQFAEFLGSNFLSHLKQKAPSTWYQTILYFEKLKIQTSDASTLLLSSGLKDAFTKFYGRDSDLRQKFIKCDGLDILESGNLTISAPQMQKYFKVSLDGIKSLISAQLREAERQKIKISYICFVGGFADSKYMQKELQSYLKHKDPRVLFPKEAALCVMKGAVKLGCDPSLIATRIATCTYAVETTNSHLETIVQKGATIEEGKSVFIKLNFKAGQPAKIKIFYSQAKKIASTTDKMANYLGELKLDVTHRKSVIVDVIFILGRAELEITAKDASTGYEYETKYIDVHSTSEKPCCIL